MGKKLVLTVPLMLTALLSGCGEMDSTTINNKARKAAERYIETQGGSVFHSRLSISQEDLNQDGRTDAVVYVRDDPAMCTFQGCTLLVFANQGRQLELVSTIRNVHTRLGQRQGSSDWPTLVVASRREDGQAAVSGEPVQVYALEFKNGYPEDATQGELTTP